MTHNFIQVERALLIRQIADQMWRGEGGDHSLKDIGVDARDRIVEKAVKKSEGEHTSDSAH